jgi:hypothetical protein
MSQNIDPENPVLIRVRPKKVSPAKNRKDSTSTMNSFSKEKSSIKSRKGSEAGIVALPEIDAVSQSAPECRICLET